MPSHQDQLCALGFVEMGINAMQASYLLIVYCEKQVLPVTPVCWGKIIPIHDHRLAFCLKFVVNNAATMGFSFYDVDTLRAAGYGVNIHNEWARGILSSNAEDLRDERIDEVVEETEMTSYTGLYSVEEGAEAPVRLALMPTGGPSGLFFHQMEVSSFDPWFTAKASQLIHQRTYRVSKAALNAHPADKYPEISINSVNPGFVRTEMTCNKGLFSAEEGAEASVRLAPVHIPSPSGVFFVCREVSSFSVRAYGSQVDK
ncbi:hypothetical protein Ancab_037063 [Ancistrocladus abbreviatus]